MESPAMTLAEITTSGGKPRISTILRHPLWAPLNRPEHWNRLASALNPVWSFTEPQARVVRVVDEAPGVKSLWLRPNRRFGAFRPGQHVLLELDIDGARHGRCFSLSHAPRADGLLRLTIKRKDGGPVSNAAHALRAGQVVRLSRAQGEFAPRTADRKLLLLAAGSGITPMMSHLHALASAGSTRDVVLLHSSRTVADLIFADELRALASRWPLMRVYSHFTRTSGHLDIHAFTAHVPDWTEREALLCGPDGFMRTLATIYGDAGRSDQLQSESFGRRAAAIDPDADQHAVSIAADGTTFTARTGQSLLDAAEAAGLQPRFGCRRGICRTCQCRKRSGTVLNVLTGQISGPGEELIQLCISTPQSAIELAL
jgi:ferredoxin-NADP reductase